MINKEILIDGIKAYLIDLLEQGKYSVEITQFNVDIQKTINAICKTGGWIPIDEGVPTDDRFVLLSFENFTIPMIGRCEEDDGGYSFYIGDETEQTCSQQDLFVNAWMDLPKKYTGDCNED